MDQQTPATGDGPRTSPHDGFPQWVVDDAARRGTSPDPWSSWSPPAGRQSSPRSVWHAVLALLLVLDVGLGAAVLAGTGSFGSAADPQDVVAASPVGPKTDKGDESAEPADVDEFPTPPDRDTVDTPLGTPMTPPAGGGAYAFSVLQVNGKDPVTYDPCRQIHYVVRPDNAPDGGDAIVQDAIARVTEVTGLQFVYDGPTAERPSEDRAPFQPDVYGDRWAPVVIAWETTDENPDLLDDVVGEAGSQWAQVGFGPEVYVTGGVSLDAEEFGEMVQNRYGREVARAVVLHELGHLVGLDHVDDDSQLMYPTTTDVYDFADGDLTGLSALGAGPCVPAL